jgi:hypothetical protein
MLLAREGSRSIMLKNIDVRIHFSHNFQIDPDILEEYGAFNISLINDLPLFVDPFLLFNSKNPIYQKLHDDIIKYLRFLRDKSIAGEINDGLLQAWYTFPEVKENWLGFSQKGNRGSGLRMDFARSLNKNLGKIFNNFGDEKITKGSHLEKLCLIRGGVGKDKISDFTTNLIKGYLLEYTQKFCQVNLSPEFRSKFAAEKVRFNYETESWEGETYELPKFNDDFILLTPKDILARDDVWINKDDLISEYDQIINSVSNEQLRAQVNNYFLKQLSRKPKEAEIRAAKASTILSFPELIEYYIRYKENNGDRAKSISEEKVLITQEIFVDIANQIASGLFSRTDFYKVSGNTLEEARARANFLKNFIEYQDGYRLLYVDRKPIKREEDFQLLFKLTWFGTPSDVSREVNDGRGPSDFKISRGSFDKTIVEFKLASNSHLEKNLENQAEIYQKASDADYKLKVIAFFNRQEREKIIRILGKLT